MRWHERRGVFRLWLFVCLLPARQNLQAATVSLHPVADTALIEIAPTNNLGGSTFFNAGSTLHTNRNRALLKFDMAGKIPAGSLIRAATLSVDVVQQGIDSPVLGIFQLHRVMRSWGEGTKLGTNSPGQGAPATLGEATWQTPFALTTNAWSRPGGVAGVDFAAAVSSEQEIRDPGGSPYVFNSSSNLIEDLRLWWTRPDQNFGWVLWVADENVPSTARRFASRESASGGPTLTIDYLPPPTLEGSRAGTNFALHFLGEAGVPYAVEFRGNFAGEPWQLLTNFSGTPAIDLYATDPLTQTQRFYRVRFH